MPTTSTSEIVTVDGVTLNTFAYNISTGTGRYSSPPIRGTNQQVAGRAGELWVPNKTADVGSFTLTMWVLGANTDGTVPALYTSQRTTFETNRNMLQQLFAKRHALLDVRATQADGTVRQAYAEVVEAVDWSTAAGRTRAEFAIHFKIPSVYWQDVSTSTQNLTSLTFSGNTATCNFTTFNACTGYIDDAVITVTGPITAPVVADSASGISVSYNGTVAAGSSWAIDCSAWTSKVNGSSVLSNTSHSGDPRFLVITPTDPPVLTLTGTGTTTATGLQVVARNKYISG